MNFRGAGADVIGDAEAAAPPFRSHPAGQRSKKWLRVGVGDRQHRNLGNRGSFFHFKTLGVFRGSNARRERIPWIERHVSDAAALDPIERAKRSGGKCFAADEPILMRVGVNQAANGAVLGRNFGLDAAPGVVVTRDDNLPLDGDTHALELLVVLGDPVVDVDERGSDVAVDRVSVIGGELLDLLIGGGVLRKSGFLEPGDELRAAFDEFNDTFSGRWKENVKLLDVRVETEVLEFRGDPFGVVLVGGRAHVVRVRREFLHISAEIVRAGNGAEFLFPLAFGARRFGGVAEERLFVGGHMVADRSKRLDHGENGCNCDGAIHCSPRRKGVLCLKIEGLKMKESRLTITAPPPTFFWNCAF